MFTTAKIANPVAKVKNVPSYRHHKATGRAVVRIEGKDYYLGKYGTDESKSAYERLIAEWPAAGQRISKPKHHIAAGPSLSISELILAYLHRTYAVSEIQYRWRPAISDLTMVG